MTRIFAHRPDPDRAPQVGLIVLQQDETIERDFRRLLPPELELLVSRVPSGDEVTPETLAAMEHEIGRAAGRLPPAARYACAAYACTSGTAQIGVARVAELMHGTLAARAVTDPVTALVGACRHLGLRRLALLSPYIADVSDRLRAVLAAAGIETPAFGSFDVAEEARVVRIDAASIMDAATALVAGGGVDGVFLSCTNLRTLDLIDPLEDRLGLPVLSSNQVLGWHIAQLAGAGPGPLTPGRLFS